MNEYQEYGQSTKQNLTNFTHQSDTSKDIHWLQQNGLFVDNAGSQLDRNSRSESLLGTKFLREKVHSGEKQHSSSLMMISKFEQDIIQLREQIQRLTLKEETSSYLNLSESQKLRNDVNRIEEINFRLRRALAERVTREQELLQKIEHLQSDLHWRSEEFLNLKINEILSSHILRPEDIMKLIQDSISAVLQNEEKMKQHSNILHAAKRRVEKPQEESCAIQTSEEIFPLNSDWGGKDEHWNTPNRISNQKTEQNFGSVDFINDEPMEAEEQECNQQADSNRSLDATISGGASSNKVMTGDIFMKDNYSAVNFLNNDKEQKSIWELVEFFESDDMGESKTIQHKNNPDTFKVNDNNKNNQIKGKMVYNEHKKLGILVNSSPFFRQQERKVETTQKNIILGRISNDIDKTSAMAEIEKYCKIPLHKLTTKDQNSEGTLKQVEKNLADSLEQMELSGLQPQTFVSEKPLENNGIFKAYKATLVEISEPTEVTVQNSEPGKNALPNYSIEKENCTNETKKPPHSTQLNYRNCSKEPTIRESHDGQKKIVSEIEQQQLKEDSSDSYILDEFIPRLNGLVRVVEVCLKLQKKIQVHLLQTIQSIGGIDMNPDMPGAVRNSSLLEKKNDLQSFLKEDLIPNGVYSTTSTRHSGKSSNDTRTKLTDGEKNEVYIQQRTASNRDSRRDTFLAKIQSTNLNNFQFETLKQKADNLWKHLRIIEANLKYQDAICYYLEACVQKKKAHASMTEKLSNEVFPIRNQSETPLRSKLKQQKTNRLKYKERGILDGAWIEGNLSLLENIQEEKTKNSNNFSTDFKGEVMEEWGGTHQDQKMISKRKDVSKFKKFDSDFTQVDKIPSRCDKKFEGNIGYKGVQKKYASESVLHNDFKNSHNKMRTSPNSILKLIHEMERDIAELETQMTNADIDPTEEKEIFHLLKEILINKQRISRYLAKQKSANDENFKFTHHFAEN